MQGRISNPFLKANPFSSSLPSSKYNNYLPTTSATYEPPTTYDLPPPSSSHYSYQYSHSNNSHPSLNRDSNLTSYQSANTHLSRDNPFTRQRGSVAGSGRETSPWRASSGPEYPPRPSYTLSINSYDPQPITSSVRQQSGRVTPTKRRDNYLSTSSADSSSTFINRVYDTDDDRSDGAAPNPFLRRQLLPTPPSPSNVRHTSPNSYDQAAFKSISQQYGSTGAEVKSYRQSEPASSYRNYGRGQYGGGGLSHREAGGNEGGFGGYNGLEYRKGSGDERGYQMRQYEGDSGGSKYKIEGYDDYRPKSSNRFEYDDKYSSKYNRQDQYKESSKKYSQPYQVLPNSYENHQTSSSNYDKYPIPSSKYDNYDLPSSKYKNYSPTSKQDQYPPPSSQYNPYDQPEQPQLSYRPNSRYDAPPYPTDSKHSLNHNSKLSSKFDFGESSHRLPPPIPEQQPSEPQRSRKSIEEQSAYESKKYKEYQQEYKEYQYQGAGYDTLGNGVPPKPISSSQVQLYQQPNREESKQTLYRQETFNQSRPPLPQPSQTNIVRFDQDEDSRYSRPSPVPTRDNPPNKHYPPSITLQGVMFYLVEWQ